MSNLESYMDAINCKAAWANLVNTMVNVCNDHAPIMITRKSEDPVVMISLEDYNAMQETTYLLRSPANAKSLLGSIAELEGVNGTERKLLEWSWFFPLKLINLLSKDIQSTPNDGVGKLEPLKHGLSGYWSCRKNDEHRIFYKQQDDSIIIVQLFNYSTIQLFNCSTITAHNVTAQGVR